MKSGDVTQFQKEVYALCRSIPHGRGSTYADIAHGIGTRACRAVGNALHSNPFAPIVPCHRVVKSDGRIGGFAQGTQEKARLLREEGIIVIGRKIQEFNKKRFSFVEVPTCP